MIGSPAVSSLLKVKHNSQNKFSLFFWDNVANTIPTVLTGAVITIEIEETIGGAVTIWTGVNTTNQVEFNIAAGASQFTWDTRPFQVVFTKSGNRDVIMSGEAQVQR